MFLQDPFGPCHVLRRVFVLLLPETACHWNVETAYQNKWRNYTFGEYVCQASAPFGGGGVSFAKADASSVCP